MEPASVIDPVLLQEKAREHTATFQQKLSEILESPRKTLYLMLGLAVSIALIFIIFVTISQIFSASSTVTKNRGQAQENSLLSEQVDNSPKLDEIRKTDIDQLQRAVGAYKEQNGQYPPNISILIPQYLSSPLADPRSHQEYNYQPSIDLASYQLWAVLSDGKEYRVEGS